MPFKSKAQMRFMFANHPDIAKRWEDTYGIPKKLPQRASGRSIEQRVILATKTRR